MDLEKKIQEAEACWRQGDFGGAREAYHSILRQRLAAVPRGVRAVDALTVADVVAAERLADLAVLFGNMQAADDLLAGLAELNRQAGNLPGADYITLKRIHVLLGRGELREAFALLDSMRPTIGEIREIQFDQPGLRRWESKCRWPDTDLAERAVLFSRLHLCMGRLMASLGQYASGLASFERGLAHTGANAPDLAQRARIPLKISSAAAWLEKGDLPAARSALAEMEPGLDERHLPGFSVQWREQSGRIALLSGDLGEALRQFEKVLAVCREHGFHRASLGAALNLAGVLVYLNQTAVAARLVAEIRNQAVDLEETSTMPRLELLSRLCRERSGSLSDGPSLPPSVSSLWESPRNSVLSEPATAEADPPDIPPSDNFLTLFEDRALGFRWLLARGHLARAADWLASMKDVFKDSDSEVVRVRTDLLEGTLRYYRGDWEQAEGVLRHVRERLRALGLRPDLWQTQRILGWSLARLRRSQDELGELADDTQRLLDGMTRSLPTDNQAIFLLNKWTADEEYIAGVIDRLKVQKDAVRRSPFYLRPIRQWRLWRDIHGLMRHIDSYQRSLATRTVASHEKVSPETRVPSLLRQLCLCKREQAVLSFLVLPDRVLVTSSRWLHLDFTNCPVTRIALRDMVSELHARIAGARGDGRGLGAAPPEGSLVPLWEQEVGRITERVASCLELPKILGDLPSRIRALTIVPDDILHGLPFAAIRAGQNYLAERFALNVAFDRLPASRPALGPVTGAALVVGVTQAAQGYRGLPGAIAELDQVGTWLARRGLLVRRLVDSRASKSAVLEEMARASLLHIACHGVFENSRPDRTGLVLVPETNKTDVLTLRDLSLLDLRGLRHVTLSSCWSADHFVLPGRWIISLPETLCRAGSHSVLACLWEVDDRLAATFMMRFYRALESLPRNEALRQTQREFWEGRIQVGAGCDARDPIYWSGFQLYGEPGPLRAKGG